MAHFMRMNTAHVFGYQPYGPDPEHLPMN